MLFSSTTPSPTDLVCNDIACFWNHCKQWIIAWFSIAALDFVCGCWAFVELIHIYLATSRIKNSSIGADIFGNNTNSKLMRGKMDESDNYDSNYALSFGNNNNNKTPSPITKSIVPSPSSNSSKMQMFETRFSQKLFLFIIFIETMLRAYLFIDAPFSLNHCEMTKIDKPSLYYAILGDLAPNFFYYAFSCLAFELSKIYYSLIYPREYETETKIKSIKYSKYIVIILNILTTLQTVVIDIYFILWFQDKDKYENIQDELDNIDFYSYGGFCLILGLYFIRFAFPIYTIYKQILIKLNYHHQKQEPVIESSISSDQYVQSADAKSYGNQQIIFQKSIKQQIKNKNNNKYSKSGKSHKYKDIVLQTDTLNYFVSSMKRTWLMALYCGIAFILRAVVILAASNYLESEAYVLGAYQFLFEQVPTLMMIYIYHYSTKNMSQRYTINR